MTQLSRRDFLGQALAFGAVGLAGSSAAEPTIQPMAERPNILYVIMEDCSPYMGCYGQPLVQTPHVDRLAAQGLRFSRAFCTSPVCSASRSAIFTGCYPQFIGAHQHRTWEWDKRPLPPPVRHLCDWFRSAGYFTCNLHPPRDQMRGPDPATGRPRVYGDLGEGKIDLNFKVEHPQPGDPFDGRDWNERKAGQPFFAHITIFETHKGEGWFAARRQPVQELVKPGRVKLEPYYPDDPVARDEYANFLDVLHLCDKFLGRLLDRLDREGLAKNTIVVVGSDHGCLFRGKQFLYDGGMHMPLIIRFPDGRKAGVVDERLVSWVDLAPTMLGFAGIRPPADAVHGHDLFDPASPPRDCVFAARDRMDDSIDRMRAVRTARYKYIRNDLPAVPYMQHNGYKEENYPTWNLVKSLYASGQLNDVQAAFARPVKPVEELYDLERDPSETVNLAQSEAHQAVLLDLRKRVRNWQRQYDRAMTYEDAVDVAEGFAGNDTWA
jgi:N-sulfoglucosamine sulfohydrolase